MKLKIDVGRNLVKCVAAYYSAQVETINSLCAMVVSLAELASDDRSKEAESSDQEKSPPAEVVSPPSEKGCTVYVDGGKRQCGAALAPYSAFLCNTHLAECSDVDAPPAVTVIHAKGE